MSDENDVNDKLEFISIRLKAWIEGMDGIKELIDTILLRENASPPMTMVEARRERLDIVVADRCDKSTLQFKESFEEYKAGIESVFESLGADTASLRAKLDEWSASVNPIIEWTSSMIIEEAKKERREHFMPYDTMIDTFTKDYLAEHIGDAYAQVNDSLREGVLIAIRALGANTESLELMIKNRTTTVEQFIQETSRLSDNPKVKRFFQKLSVIDYCCPWGNGSHGQLVPLWLGKRGMVDYMREQLGLVPIIELE